MLPWSDSVAVVPLQHSRILARAQPELSKKPAGIQPEPRSSSAVAQSELSQSFAPISTWPNTFTPADAGVPFASIPTFPPPQTNSP